MKSELIRKMEKLMNSCQFVETDYSCSKCRDLGYTFEINEKNHEVAVPCECLSKKQSLEKLEKCGLSEAFKKKTFGTYVCEKPYQATAKHKAFRFCDNFITTNSSLLLCGSPGAGKTHLGIASMLKLIDENVSCRYVEYNTMIMSLKQSVMDEENFIREMAKYTNPRVLFIDDFLKGRTTPADINYIYRIINSRYLKDKPLIISSEKTVEDILGWDEAIGSRLIEMAGENIISFDKNTSNYRLRKKMI